ncbi:hypothetical protein SDJN03_22820, partial [Cucurbita argyrosperma subsp. sororia]
MGSCASLCSKSECSAVKPPPAPSESVKDKFEIPPSPIKHYKLQDNADSVFKDISVVPHHHKTPSGSKEEAFFDSRAWLDSDCEDFFSVKGDFTPSRDNTPIHHRFTAGTPRASQAGADDKPSTFNSSPLPTKRRKKLADLFRESLGDEASFAFLNHDDNRKTDEPCLPGTGSVCNSERTVGNGVDDKNMIGFESKFCCLPPLVSRNSWRERKEELKVVNGVS